jgi:hypothetical protein
VAGVDAGIFEGEETDVITVLEENVIFILHPCTDVYLGKHLWIRLTGFTENLGVMCSYHFGTP